MYQAGSSHRSRADQKTTEAPGRASARAEATLLISFSFPPPASIRPKTALPHPDASKRLLTPTSDYPRPHVGEQGNSEEFQVVTPKSMGFHHFASSDTHWAGHKGRPSRVGHHELGGGERASETS